MPPTFCRHNRFVENCPICSKKEQSKPGTVSGAASSTGTAGARRTSPAQARSSASSSHKRRTPRASSQLVVRHVTRASDDGYENDLVPGLRSSEDAGRLADELAWSLARLEELRTAPPGLYAEVAALAAAGEAEEGLWLAFLIAYLSPLEGTEDPFSAIAAVRVPWAAGALPDLDGVELGPRSAHAPDRGDRTLAAYRAWAAKGGSQHEILAGEPTWDLSRRFDRAFERLALPGLGRVPRYEFVTLAGALGLIDAVPQSLLLADAAAPPTVAAKRIFGIGDPLLIGRRAGELAALAGFPLAAFDLALQNWGAGPEGRATAGSALAAEPDPELRAPIAAALGV